MHTYLIRLTGRLTAESWAEPTLADAFATAYTVMRAAGTGAACTHLTISTAVIDLTYGTGMSEAVIAEAATMAELRAADPRFATTERN